MAIGNDVTLKVGFDIDKFQSELAKTNGILNKWGSSVTSTLKGAIAGFGMMEIAKGVISVTSEFQKFEAILTNTLGSNSKAVNALREIKDFAVSTPFEVNEITAAYVRWANMGLSPTIDKMKKIGDVASSLGAGFEQTAEAFKDLLVGQTKRIEEVGISATQMNGKIQLSFKGVNIEVEKNAEGVQKALNVYSQLNGVLGTADAISETLGGRISNLSDAWNMFLLSGGEKSSGPLIYTIKTLTNLLNGVHSEVKTIEQPMSVWSHMMQALGIQTDGAKEAMRGLGQGATSMWELSDEGKKKLEDQANALLANKKAAEEHAAAVELANKKLQERRDLIAQITRNLEIQAKFDAEKAKSVTPDGVKPVGGIDAMPDKVGSPFSLGVSQEILDQNAVSIERYAEQAEMIKSLNKSIMDSFVDLGINVVEVIGSKLGDSSVNLGKGLKVALGRFLSGIGKMFIQFGVAAKGFQELLKNITNPAAAIGLIAAGAILVGIGAAIVSSAGNGPSGGGGGSSSSAYEGRSSVNGNTQSNMKIEGELRADGSVLLAVIRNAAQDNKIRKG